MENTNIDSNSAVVRKYVADQLIAKFGASYLNPLLGMSASETCSKIESVMELLYHLTTKPAWILIATYRQQKSPDLQGFF